MKLISFDALISGATRTMLRFPLTLLCAAGFTALSIYLVDYRPSKELEAYIRVLTVLVLGLSATLAVDLYAERRAPQQKMFLRLGIVVFLLIYFFTLPEKLIFANYVRYSLWLLGFHLLVAFAPYLPPREINGFWQYNQILFVRILTAILYSSVLFLGISAALVAVNQLFGVRIDPDVYAKLWLLLIGIFNTWFFLADVPADFTALDIHTFYPLPLKLFTQYVLLPLVMLYLVILYAYEIKILLEWNLPKGWVTYLIIAFAIGGIFSFLLIYPLREMADNQWIRIFERWFYLALLPLLVLLYVAIGRRIWDYGFTELRYFVLTLAVWLTGISIYFLMSKVKNIQYIPISLGAVAFLVSFGPWGAFSVSNQSQLARFKTYFAQHSPLQDGKITQNTTRKALPDSIQSEVLGIIDYFSRKEEVEVLQAAFAEKMDSLFKKDVSSTEKRGRILAMLSKKGYDLKYNGYDYYEEAAKSMVYFSTQPTEGEDIRNYDFYLTVQNVDKKIKIADNQVFSTKINLARLNFELLQNDKNLITINLKKLAELLLKNYRDKTYEVPPSVMTLEQKNEKCQVKIRFNNINVQVDNSQAKAVDSFSANILIKLLEKTEKP
ncbi:MAG: DUF4153 domain-containing protein [Microscillaceae bacterium]|jgi:hypothetical protein|nr:DUF4153 domain-containing protein [Microscillaceae bacterium]